MNANELADELEMLQVAQYGDKELCVAPTKIHKEAATMLRQQQSEIEALKKFKAEIDAENKKLFEAVQRANDVWDKATGKAQEK